MSQTAWKKIQAGHYLHLETGIKVRKRLAHREFGYAVGMRWEVITPTREGQGVRMTARTLSQAQGRGIDVLVCEMRRAIVEAWSAAHSL